MMQAKEHGEQLSVIQKYAGDTHLPYQTVMKVVEISGTYTGAPKYLKQRDQPLEIPMDCIRKLCDAIDTTFDERISLEEITQYVFLNKTQLPFEEGIIQKMFSEAAQGRGYISDTQMNAPLTHEEVAAAVRGRHAWDCKSKTWNVKYRPYRDYWIAMLLTVNDKIFALPMPKIIPTAIKAQYEINNEISDFVDTKIT